MSELQTLMDRFATLHRRHVEIEHEIAEVESEIFTLNGTPRQRRQRATPAEADELVKLMIMALQEAGEPLPPAEIAARLGVEPTQIAHRLRQAVATGFVEKAGNGRYRVAPEVPTL